MDLAYKFNVNGEKNDIRLSVIADSFQGYGFFQFGMDLKTNQWKGERFPIPFILSGSIYVYPGKYIQLSLLHDDFRKSIVTYREGEISKLIQNPEDAYLDEGKVVPGTLEFNLEFAKKLYQGSRTPSIIKENVYIIKNFKF